MHNNHLKIALGAFLISVVGVFVIDYFSHLLFSQPMETLPYFMTKFTLFFVFSFVFLSRYGLEERSFAKIFAAGVIVALIWGSYYNIFPALFDYYPYGISLRGLTFLGMGYFGTGLAFGIVHTLAFVGGYYVARFTLKRF